MVGYRLTRDGVGPWMFCGTTIDEILGVLKVELEEDAAPGNERSSLTLMPIEITQEEIDNMPEFPGW